jgi:hypothetical protein
MTLPLAGAAGLEPCTVEGAVEAFMAAMVKMYRYERREELSSLRQAKVAVGLSGTK